MKKLLFVVLIALLALSLALPVLASDKLGPCNTENEPGHSEYAEHHIVPFELGHDAHIPGSHGGYSVCLGTGRTAHQP